MNLFVDREFETLVYQLTNNEHAQLETNLLAEGCRDALAVWAGEPPTQICLTCLPGTPFSRAASDVEVEAGAVVWRCQGCGHVEHRPWVLLDGHTRYHIVTFHGLPYEIREVMGVHTREEAMTWIINHQVGRRNLWARQATYLRGVRYNLEKHQGERTDLTSGHNVQKLAVTPPQEEERPATDEPTTAKRLAAEYHVDEKTIRRDGQFAAAVDTLADTLGPEMRQTVLAGDTKLPKRHVIKGAQTVRRLKHRLQAKDFSFLQGLAKCQQQEALAMLTRLPADEHVVVNTFLDQPGLSTKERLDVILRRLPAQPRDARQRLYELHASEDPRNRARALQEAAGDTPILLPPLRHLTFAGAGLQRAVENLDQCLQLDPAAPWTPRLEALITQVQALQEGELTQILAEVEAYFEADPEADVPASESVDEAEDGDGAVDQGMPEVDDPASESVDEAEDGDGAVDQGMPELGMERDRAVASPTSLEPILDAESRALAEVESGVPACGWCWSTQTWRAEPSGRIHCDECHAVYNPATGDWDPGEQAKHRTTSDLGAGLG